jgi:hypothetical protein
VTRTAWSRLVVLTLAVHGAVPASGVAAAKNAAAVSKPPLLPRGQRSGLDKRVATLAKALDLDARQQAALRKVLQDQREQVQRIWLDESASPADRITAMRQVSMHTAGRIRGLLNEDQRKKYDPPAQADPGKTIGGAHVEDWMNGGKNL